MNSPKYYLQYLILVAPFDRRPWSAGGGTELERKEGTAAGHGELVDLVGQPR